jgi:superfamily II DNA or RNA helicase
LENSTKSEQKKLKPELPPLETYQQEAVDFIISNWKNMINSLCALDVGMGKTRVACEIIFRLSNSQEQAHLLGYTLVCCSATDVRDSIWAETLRKYNRPNQI